MDSRTMGKVLRLVGIGWYVAVCIGGGAAVGFWIDGKLAFNPAFTLLGLGLGVAVAILGMYRMLMTVLSNTSSLAGSDE